MARLLMDNQKLMVLLVLTFSISLGGLGDAEAARKSKFRYEEPNVDKWVSYCQARHPKKSLQSCCSRRNGSCAARCQKSTYPNTAYDTQKECLEECQGVHNQCRGVSEVVTNLKVCKRQYNTVVDRNLCCEQQLKDLLITCSDNNSLCKKSYNSCFKKFSKKQYRKIRNRAPNPQWMKTYCQNPENRQDVSQFECCGRMIKRCLASCNGYPDSPKAKSDCNDRCVQHFEICKSK
jgi:hypothetical protein